MRTLTSALTLFMLLSFNEGFMPGGLNLVWFNLPGAGRQLSVSVTELLSCFGTGARKKIYIYTEYSK